MINMLAQQTSAIELLKKDNEERKTREASQQKEEDSTPILGGSRLMLTQGPISNAPSPGPYGQSNGIAPQATGFRAF
jgi:clathrin heavy chain